MSDLTPEQSARALELRNVWADAVDGVSVVAATVSPMYLHAWLAVEKHVLESHKLEWRPVTRDEIQAGWEIRARRGNGSESAWGVAYRQNHHGNWFTKSDTLLTYDAAGWTYETTAPKPELDQRVEALAKALHQESKCGELWPCSITADPYRERARRLLASLDDLKKS